MASTSVITTIVPPAGQAMEDPNLPLRVRADNASTTTDIQVDVGGRRYGLQGDFNPPTQWSGELRLSQSVAAADGYVPAVCVRKENPYPEAGRVNTVNAYVESLDLRSDQDLSYVLTVGGTLTGASFADPEGYDDGDVAVEYDTSATAISGQTRVAGPFGIDGDGNRNQRTVESGEGARIPVINGKPTCVLVSVATDATIDTWLRVRGQH